MTDRSGLAAVYQGDETLNRLLKEAGSSYDAAGARALLAGVLAAPSGHYPGAWLELVAPRMPPALATQLAALRADLAQHLPALDPGPGASAGRLAALRAEL